MANAQISTSLTIVSSLLGFQAISLTEFATSAQSLIAAGSKIEIGGAYFTFSGNETPNASSWTAIGTGNVAYIGLTPTGSAGSQVLTAAYSDTAPVWSTSKQGWYASAASIARYIGGVYKAGATSYEDVFIIPSAQEVIPDSTIMRKRFQIGSWDMDATASTIISVGSINPPSVRNLFGVVFDDNTLASYPIPCGPVAGTAATAMMQIWFTNVNASQNVIIYRLNGGLFDSATFNDSAINRGWITVEYEV